MLAVMLLVGCAGDPSPSSLDGTEQTPTATATLSARTAPTRTTAANPIVEPSVTPILAPTLRPTTEPEASATSVPTRTSRPQPTATPTPAYAVPPSAADMVGQLADIDVGLAVAVAGYDWVADGLTGREWLPLAFARDLAKHDVETAKLLLEYPYMADDITPLEGKTIVLPFFDRPGGPRIGPPACGPALHGTAV